MTSNVKTQTRRSRSGFFDGKLAVLRELQLSDDSLVFDPEELDRGLLLDLVNYMENPVYADDNDKRDPGEILREISSQNNDPKMIAFDLPNFSIQQADYDFLCEKLKNDVEWTKSNIKCKNCGSNTVVFYEKQTKSGDEGMTTFYRCLTCSAKWRSG